MKVREQAPIAFSASVILCAAFYTATLHAAPVSITLPGDMTGFKPGKGADIANGSCKICHAADYVYMQPPLPKEKWTAIIKKMKKVYGCPVQDGDIAALADYLAGQNGPK